MKNEFERRKCERSAIGFSLEASAQDPAGKNVC